MDKKTLLVIDDEADFLQLITQRLEHWGYRVLTARSGKQGLEILREKRPDLVLVDYVLPDAPGSEISRQIKSDEALKQIPVIFFTASPHLLHPEMLHSIRADDYLAKPFDPPELEAKIRHFLSGTGTGR